MMNLPTIQGIHNAVSRISPFAKITVLTSDASRFNRLIVSQGRIPNR